MAVIGPRIFAAFQCGITIESRANQEIIYAARRQYMYVCTYMTPFMNTYIQAVIKCMGHVIILGLIVASVYLVSCFNFEVLYYILYSRSDLLKRYNNHI